MGWLAAPGVTGIHVVRPDLLGIPAPPGPVVDANGTHTEFPNPATTPDEAHLLSPHDDLHVWL